MHQFSCDLFRLWVIVLINSLVVVNSNSVNMIKRLKKNIKDTKPAVDTHKTILFPLDYSFKAVSDFSGWSYQSMFLALHGFRDVEVLFEKPRGRDAKFTGVRFLLLIVILYFDCI